MLDVGADVKEFMGRDWFEEPFAEPSTDPRPHSRQSESNDAHEGAPVAEIEPEGNVALKRRRVGLIVNKHGAIPARVKHRFAREREHSGPRRFAQGAAIGADTSHF